MAFCWRIYLDVISMSLNSLNHTGRDCDLQDLQAGAIHARDQVAADFQRKMVTCCLRKRALHLLHRKLARFPSSKATLDDDHPLGLGATLAPMIRHGWGSVHRILTKEGHQRLVCKLVAKRLEVLQSFQCWYCNGAFDGATGSVISAKIHHDHVAPVPGGATRAVKNNQECSRLLKHVQANCWNIWN